MPHQMVSVPGAVLEVVDGGAGDPILLIQTALTADELVPISRQPALAPYRTILTHRRGYAGSSPLDRPGSVIADAEDCAALLAALGIDRAHVVGLSYSGAVALQLARDDPDRVVSLTLVEPPPVHTPSAPEFRAVNEHLIRVRQERGVQAALDEFLDLAIGADWREVSDAQLPGSSEQMRQDAQVFFDGDLPALLAWTFTPEDAAAISCPVLYIGGTDSGPWFAEVHDLMRSWFPQASDAIIAGADHSLALTHAPQVAHAIAGFCERQRRPG